MQDHCIELLLSSPQKVVVDVREMTTFRQRHATLSCKDSSGAAPTIYENDRHFYSQENERFFATP